MKKTKHPFLEIDSDKLAAGTLPKDVDKLLTLPEKRFPPKFFVKDDKFLCAGYFACYDRRLSIKEAVKACKERNWTFLANLVGDFLIISLDFSTEEIFVLTDQTGKFPCYFAVVGNWLYLSTDFAAVKSSLPSAHLDVSVALDYIADNQFGVISDQTLIAEIRQVPPGTLLTIQDDFTYKFKPLLNLESLFGEGDTPYASVAKFADDFLVVLENLVHERLEALNGIPFTADLSSGFDSSLVCYLVKKITRKPLVCYAMISKHTRKDTEPEIIREFAKKHDLEARFINVDEYYPFAKTHDLEWNVKYPGEAMQASFYYFLRQRGKDRYLAAFRGDGGDEVYLSFKLDLLAPFPVQNEYFLTIERLQKFSLNKILTEKGTSVLLDQARFQKKRAYPALLSPSVVTGNLITFPFHWETGVWPITPFADPRLVKFARRIPHQELKGPMRQEIWKERKDIFVPSQFRPKIGPSDFVELFLKKKRSLVLSVLRKSILADKGWLAVPKIIDDLSQQRVDNYLGDALVYLHNLIRLEYFLQHNNIKVPDSL